MRFKLPWKKRHQDRTEGQLPATAYDQWSATYDLEPDNLMIALDEIIFAGLLREISIDGKVVADIGCGTGRNWPLLLSLQPAQLCGYDVSRGMLDKLRAKYPDAVTYLSEDHTLTATQESSVDLIVSTLALAHFRNLEETFREWDRVLKPMGHIIFTDYHPDSLQHGGTITFEHSSGRVRIQHHIYTLEAIRQTAAQYGWTESSFADRKIDAAVKHFYEQQHALPLYEKFRGKPIIYGILFRKG
jgi:ubiquinone/menaquinone biosynthesis C-methylase UbiE